MKNNSLNHLLFIRVINGPLYIIHCPSILSEGRDTYSPIALKNLFGGKKVSYILPYDSPEKNEEDNEKFIENVEHVSISGVQGKEVCVIEKGQIRLSKKGEQSTHILKPIPLSRLRRVRFLQTKT